MLVKNWLLIAVALFWLLILVLWCRANSRRHLESLKSQADQGRDMMPRDQKTFLNQ